MHATQDQALHPPLSAYVEAAMRQAVYDKLEDGSFAGRIPACIGVVAFAPSLRACEDELQSTLEEWILVDPGGMDPGCPQTGAYLARPRGH